MEAISLTKIKELPKDDGVSLVTAGEDYIDKINEIIRFLNALDVEVILTGSHNETNIGPTNDQDLIKRFGEWIPKEKQ